jgi:hypothetical protein
VFVANRSISSGINAEFVFPPIKQLGRHFDVNQETKCVRVYDDMLPSKSQTACWRGERLGCHLVHDHLFDRYSVPAEVLDSGAKSFASGIPDPWTVDNANAKAGVDLERLENVVEAHFADTRLHARAVLLVQDGNIVYERYGDSCHERTRLLGWSASKTMLNALVGIRVKQGKLSLNTTAGELLPEWANSGSSGRDGHGRGSGDENTNHPGQITVRQLLQMSDGLNLDEW